MDKTSILLTARLCAGHFGYFISLILTINQVLLPHHTGEDTASQPAQLFGKGCERLTNLRKVTRLGQWAESGIEPTSLTPDPVSHDGLLNASAVSLQSLSSHLPGHTHHL